VSALRELRPGWVVLLYHNRKACGLRAPIVQHRRLFRRGLLPLVPPPLAPVDEEEQPHPEPAPAPVVGEGQAEPALRALPEPAEEAEG
jgi:hypothetical protein